MTSFRVVIPARMDSQRLPGKPLREVAGRALVLRTADRARDSGASEVIVATDDLRIATACEDDGLQVVMTDTKHQSGTDRIAEVSRICNWATDDIVVNVQGDEPCIPSQNIGQTAAVLEASGAEIATLSTALEGESELHDPNIVKVVVTERGQALYFSRAMIPWNSDGKLSTKLAHQRHLGIYAYRVRALQRFAAAPVCELERQERLEQLRALWFGWPIAVAEALYTPGPGVDTEADLQAASALFANASDTGDVQ